MEFGISIVIESNRWCVNEDRIATVDTDLPSSITNQGPYYLRDLSRCSDEFATRKNQPFDMELNFARYQIEFDLPVARRPGFTAASDLTCARTYHVPRFDEPDDVFPIAFRSSPFLPPLKLNFT